ncbi:MAG: hypothetical protein HY659_05415 [Rhizobiales bacterium]|nr:hypothetical protein [Hyphomicrobiales bacterium]
MTENNSVHDTTRDRVMRGWSDVLNLWRLCNRTACRRTRACGGKPLQCFKLNFPLLPEGVRAWFEGVGQAQDQKLTFDEAMEWLDTTDAGEAFREWTKAVKASVPRQQTLQ